MIDAQSNQQQQQKQTFGNVQNLVLFQKFEEFIRYFEPIVEKFPSYEKPALCTSIKSALYRIMERIIVTNKTKSKLQGWHQIDTELEILKFYVRHSFHKGSKYLSGRSYETATKKLLEIGRIVGGLIKRGY